MADQDHQPLIMLLILLDSHAIMFLNIFWKKMLLISGLKLLWKRNIFGSTYKSEESSCTGEFTGALYHRIITRLKCNNSNLKLWLPEWPQNYNQNTPTTWEGFSAVIVNGKIRNFINVFILLSGSPLSWTEVKIYILFSLYSVHLIFHWTLLAEFFTTLKALFWLATSWFDLIFYSECVTCKCDTICDLHNIWTKSWFVIFFFLLHWSMRV